MYNLHPYAFGISVRFIISLWCDAVFCSNIIEGSTHRFKIMVYYALGIFTPMQTMWIRLARWQKGINIDCLLSYFLRYSTLKVASGCIHLMGKYAISLDVMYLLFALYEEQQNVRLFSQVTFYMYTSKDKIQNERTRSMISRLSSSTDLCNATKSN